MARPPKNNCDYFPHLTTMRNHKKVKMLRNKFGQVLGYAFWSMFLEYLTEADGNEIEHTEMEWDSFASELGVSATEIKDMIEYCLKIEILFLRLGFLFSTSLDEYLAPVYEKRAKNKEASGARKRRVNGRFTKELGITDAETTTNMGVVASEMPQIKVEGIKVKERVLRQNTLGNDEWLTKTSELLKTTKEKLTYHCEEWIKWAEPKGKMQYAVPTLQGYIIEDFLKKQGKEKTEDGEELFWVKNWEDPNNYFQRTQAQIDKAEPGYWRKFPNYKP
jgi:hypothetical protein